MTLVNSDGSPLKTEGARKASNGRAGNDCDWEDSRAVG